MRDALSLTDQAIAFGQGKLLRDDVITMLGVVGRDEIAALMEALKDGSAPRLLELTAELAERNADFADVLSGLIETLHSAAVSRATTNDAGAFLADELQLYYQIALVGLRDLPIVPDPRSGFEMTLLRMLAFTPEREQTSQGGGSGGVPPREPAAETSSPDDKAFSSSQESDADAQASVEKDRAKSAAEPAEERGEDSAKDKSIEIALESGTVPDSPSTETTAPIASAGPDAERWYAMVNQLSLGGVAKMIAEHSIPSSFSESAITLLLSGSTIPC